MARPRAEAPEATAPDRQVLRWRRNRRDLLLISLPLLVGVLVAAGYSWFTSTTNQATNRDLAALVLRTFAHGIDYGDPLPVGVERPIQWSDLLLTVNDQFRLTKLIGARTLLVDAWGTPLGVRRGSDWLEVRCAGADRIMGSADDEVAVRPLTPAAPATPGAANANAPVD